MTDVLSVIVRALSFILLFQAAGLAIFVALFGHRLANTRGTVRRLGQVSALAAVVLVAAHYALEAARMAGEMSGMFDPLMQQMVWHSSSRWASMSHLLGLLLIAIGFQGETRRWTSAAVAGAVLAIGAFTLTGHTSVNVHRGATAALLLLHLLVVGFWFGALVPLALASLRETPVRAADLTARFTAVATWLVPVILVAGIAIAVVLLPSVAALTEPYGELLIAKVVGFALLMGLAAANKWRLGPALVQGAARTAKWFRRCVAIEYVLIAVVLTITAVMTSLFSPEG
jgi:putative copper resistance protein D